ncbi:MAG: ABC transporter permease [Candidatus Thermoplasmatota archaeon]|nr:ABC transporter permease [Candidatus Thermoplasmatota archaeon]
MKESLGQTWAFFKNHFLNRVRTKKFVVWVIITPMLLIGFLNLIGGEEETEMEIEIAVVDNDQSQYSDLTLDFLNSEERVSVSECEDLQNAIDMMKRGDVEGVLVIPDDLSEKWRNISNEGNFTEPLTFKFYHLSGEHEDLIETILKGVTAEINEIILGDEMRRPVEIEPRALDLREEAYVDFLLPSGIMIVILQGGFFSASNTSSGLSELMLNKRLKISPVPQVISVGGMVTMDGLFTTFSGIIAMITGLILFGVSVSIWGILGLIPVILISSLTFSFIGSLIGRIASDRISSQGLSSMTIFPLIFFTQAYFFHWLFPSYVQKISRVLPIYPAVEMLKRLLFYSSSISYYGMEILRSLIWLAVMLAVFWFLHRE